MHPPVAVNKKSHYLGFFQTADAAHAAADAEKILDKCEEFIKKEIINFL